MERVTGYSAGEMIGNPNTSRLMYPNAEEYERVMAEWPTRLGDYRDWRVWLTRKDNERRLISWTSISRLHPIPGWTSWSIGFDITEQHLARERLELLQSIIAALLDKLTSQDVANAIVGEVLGKLGGSLGTVFLLDEDGETLRLVSRYGISDDMYEQYRRTSLKVSAVLSDAVRRRESIWIESYEDYVTRYPAWANYVRMNGTQTAVAMPLWKDDQVIGGIYFSFRERRPLQETDRALFITIARQCAQALERAQLFESERAARAAAEEADQLMLKFLAMISHELRTPLTPIKGFVTTLLAEDVTWETLDLRRFLHIINEETDKLSSLVEQLLEISRLQAKNFPLQLADERVKDALALAMSQLQAVSANHRLVVDIPPDLPLIWADARRLAQVLVNLVENASKYSPPETAITVQVRPAEGSIRFRVVDEGVGIPGEMRDSVFEPFRRLQGATYVKGAGLGLAICKGLVEAHGGRIWIEDAPTGTGTVIAFTIPQAGDQPTAN